MAAAWASIFISFGEKSSGGITLADIAGYEEGSWTTGTAGAPSWP
jgi:hypothetical protein